MKMKKLILWIVLVVLIAFLIWFVASVLFGPFTYAQGWNITQQVEQNKSMVDELRSPRINLDEVVNVCPDNTGCISMTLRELINRLSHDQFNEMQMILDYCYSHADSPNPVQELLDKGLVSSNWNGTNCAVIKQNYDKLLIDVTNIVESQRIK